MTGHKVCWGHSSVVEHWTPKSRILAAWVPIPNTPNFFSMTLFYAVQFMVNLLALQCGVSVAQLIEHWTLEPRVLGSNPQQNFFFFYFFMQILCDFFSDFQANEINSIHETEFYFYKVSTYITFKSGRLAVVAERIRCWTFTSTL